MTTKPQHQTEGWFYVKLVITTIYRIIQTHLTNYYSAFTMHRQSTHSSMEGGKFGNTVNIGTSFKRRPEQFMTRYGSRLLSLVCRLLHSHPGTHVVSALSDCCAAAEQMNSRNKTADTTKHNFIL